MFAIIKVGTEERISEHETGALAAAEAKLLNDAAKSDGSANRYRVVRVASEVTTDWRAREDARFNNGTYKPVPWCFESWYNADHFAHVSTDDPNKVAFTPDDAYGDSDRQLRMRPGRYLERYYSNTHESVGLLPHIAIRDWCSKFAAENENNVLQFAHTPNEIEEVYTHGPSSCMSHPADTFASPCHPVRVYGAGDLAIAYIEDGDEDEDEDDIHVTARCVCWPNKLRYGRVYGDAGRLIPLLEAAGYTADGDLTGARLLRFEAADEQFIAPYLDYPNYNVGDDGDYLCIGGGYIEAQRTDGLTDSEEGEDCECCSERTTGEMHRVNDEMWCEDCYENYTRCAGCEEHYRNAHVEHSEVTGDSYCQSCAADMDRTHCGELADNENDCHCSECEEHRRENFELDGEGHIAAPERFIPIRLKETSPTVFDARQFELPLLESWCALSDARARRGYQSPNPYQLGAA